MKQITCTVCPRGCLLNVDEENGYTVTGNVCPRGVAYGKAECVSPVRTLTTTVSIRSADLSRCPVRTDQPVPKAMLTDVMALLRKVQIQAPVRCGHVVIANVLDTGANVIVTRDIEVKRHEGS
ncbi:MAG: DUF1667 domain-containing protein [Ruminococcaceae bacterium]|nr:DUF1667 domain-containing protein [Oscillospiraceae bacterium]